MLVKNILGQTIDIPEASYHANKNAFIPVLEKENEKVEEVKSTDTVDGVKQESETTEMKVEEVKTTVMKKK